VYKLHQDWHKKETLMLNQIEELTRARDLFSYNEKQLKITITNMEEEYRSAEIVFLDQIKQLQDTINDLENKIQHQSELYYKQKQDMQRDHMLEIKQMKEAHFEVIQRFESNIVKLKDEIAFLDQQKTNFSIEFKKLFQINAELEKEIADLKLEIEGLNEAKVQYFHKDKTKLERLTEHSCAQEKQHMARIQEVKSLNMQIGELETEHANNVAQLYHKIAQQEQAYKVKVDEIATLKHTNAELLMNQSQFSHSYFERSKQEEKVEEVELSHFRSINHELEQRYKNKIEQLQSQIVNHEAKESQCTHEIISLRD
jgi:hypothetical protein